MKYTEPEVAADIEALLSELSSARKDAERYNAALIFALPKGTKVSSYLNGTIDAASRSEETRK